jgi:hypothetical protein
VCLGSGTCPMLGQSSAFLPRRRTCPAT